MTRQIENDKFKHIFISYLIVSVKLNCFSWKKTENKEKVALITGSMKEPLGGSPGVLSEELVT